MRIAIVNDLRIAVETLRAIISTTPGLEVAWVAWDGAEAVERCQKDTPDLVLMDLFMPVMNGVEATKAIMTNTPCPIVIVTSSVDENAAVVFDAMGAGALDAVSTPILGEAGHDQAQKEFLGKIATISKLLSVSRGKPKHSFSAQCGKWLLAIGSSTGGPHALAKVLSHLPKDFPAAVVIVQHVDQSFAGGFGEWLNDQSTLPVRLAREGDVPEPGLVLVAGTNDHLIYTNRHCLSYTPDPVAMVYRPSVDVFFKSVADHWQGHTIGVLLTGMGRDGAEGMLRLRQKGEYTIAQNKDTCAVYGMPKAAVELNAAIDILSIDVIADAVIHQIAHHSSISRRN